MTALRLSSLRPAALFFMALMAVPASGQNADPGSGIRPEEKRSGYSFMSRETRAMQDDDLANPGTLWALEGEALWRTATGASGKSCATCHQDAAVSMKGVAARHPAFEPRSGVVINLEQRINLCRVDRQQAPPLAYESKELLALTTHVANQSRGMPVQVVIDGPTRPFFQAGRDLYFQRQGQLNLACNQCHDEHWDGQLRGDRVTQGHGNAYPEYRLEWQTVGSLQRRLRGCNTGVRAEPFPYGAQEYVNLELYLAWRAQGLPIETPGVRP
ncbi:MAG TPA: sulfur oxidation c-type cytochrome SoxA [Candidatus Methylomirabilis sp.]|nr:sulfur oxidation c-type cytochrome SoxA [Candidatus Methylomirabilis sp.]